MSTCQDNSITKITAAHIPATLLPSLSGKTPTADFQPNSLYVYATLHVRDTYTLYLETVHIGDNLYDTTVTFTLSNSFRPLIIGCISVGDGVATNVYSYSE